MCLKFVKRDEHFWGKFVKRDEHFWGKFVKRDEHKRNNYAIDICSYDDICG